MRRAASPSTSTAFRSWCMASNRGPRTTATTATRSIIRWWPATRWPATTTACTKGSVWETVSCTPCLRQGQVHTAQGVQAVCPRGRAQSETPRTGWSICASTPATPTARRWTDLTDEKVRFIGRLKSNAVLERRAAPHLGRPVGRPPKEGYEEVIELGPYQAASWKHSQRLLLVDRRSARSQDGATEPAARLFLPRGRLEAGRTRWSGGAGALPSAGHVRGSPGRVSTSDRAAPFARRLSRPTKPCCGCRYWPSTWCRCCGSNTKTAAGSCFDLARFQRDVLKAGGRVVRHARRLVLQVARVVMPFWEQLVACLQRWKLPRRFPPPRGARVRAWMPPPRHAFLHEVRRC